MVLDGEEDKASRVLLKEGFVCLLRLNGRRDCRLDVLDIGVEVIWNADNGLENVFFVRV